jgi:hypothetical protein
VPDTLWQNCRETRRCAPVLAMIGVALLTLVSFHRVVHAQGSIGIYTDTAGNSCSLSDNSQGVINAYVVVRPGQGGVSNRGPRLISPPDGRTGVVHSD